MQVGDKWWWRCCCNICFSWGELTFATWDLKKSRSCLVAKSDYFLDLDTHTLTHTHTHTHRRKHTETHTHTHTMHMHANAHLLLGAHGCFEKDIGAVGRVEVRFCKSLGLSWKALMSHSCHMPRVKLGSRTSYSIFPCQSKRGSTWRSFEAHAQDFQPLTLDRVNSNFEWTWWC